MLQVMGLVLMLAAGLAIDLDDEVLVTSPSLTLGLSELIRESKAVSWDDRCPGLINGAKWFRSSLSRVHLWVTKEVQWRRC